MCLRILFIVVALIFSNLTIAKTYYLSFKGKDSNNGLSIRSAWKTVDKINKNRFFSGDSILFEGGSIFKGRLVFEADDHGSIDNPVFIGTFGKGKATINAGNGTALFFYNVAGFFVSDIIAIGSGVSSNQGTGFHFVTDQPGTNYDGIKINRCEAKGFRVFGILIQSRKDTLASFANVQILNCVATENGEGGIGSLSTYPSISHKKFLVVGCKAFHNKGILSKTDNHSGNGIVLSGVNGLLIDSCEAFENGEHCSSKGGGPVGIWVWHCSNGVISRSISHNNHSGTCAHDGGGFDIDGGSVNCVIRDCVSYDNEGAGYLVCEFGSPNPFSNHLIENNISRNDGLKNGYGAITISGAGAGFPVSNTIIRKNLILVEGKGIVNGIPSAIYLNEQAFHTIRFEDNRITVEPGNLVLKVDSLLAPGQVTFLNNFLDTKGSEFKMSCSKCDFSNLSVWKSLFIDQQQTK